VWRRLQGILNGVLQRITLQDLLYDEAEVSRLIDYQPVETPALIERRPLANREKSSGYEEWKSHRIGR